MWARDSTLALSPQPIRFAFMATSLCGVGAWPRVLRHWVLTYFVTLLLLPRPSNLGNKEDHNQSVCGKPWWPGNLNIRHWPWEVSLHIEYEYVCGGALIGSSWVISAAHCIQGNKEYSVMLGNNKLQPKGSPRTLKIPVDDIIVHPKYWGRKFMRNDIALLHLETPITFNKYVQPICLLEHNFNLKPGTQCWMTGWGKSEQYFLDNLTLSPELRETKVFIIDNKSCNHIFRKKFFYLRVVPLIRKNTICVISYEGNLCYGDPGDPLACEIDGRWIQAGVLSWRKTCIKPQNPGVYTRLSKYTGWVKKQMNHGALPEPCRASCLLLLSWMLQLPVSR